MSTQALLGSSGEGAPSPRPSVPTHLLQRRSLPAWSSSSNAPHLFGCAVLAREQTREDGWSLGNVARLVGLGTVEIENNCVRRASNKTSGRICGNTKPKKKNKTFHHFTFHYFFQNLFELKKKRGSRSTRDWPPRCMGPECRISVASSRCPKSTENKQHTRNQNHHNHKEVRSAPVRGTGVAREFARHTRQNKSTAHEVERMGSTW